MMLACILLLMIGLKLEMTTSYFVLLGTIFVIQAIKLGIEIQKAISN